MHNVYCACYKLGKPRCKGRAVCAHVQYKYCNIVHHAVGQAPDYDRYKRGLRESVRLYQHLQIVRYQKESTERRKAFKIINGVIKRNVVCAEQACDGLREYKHRRRYDNAHYYKHRQVLGKQLVRLPVFLLRHKYCNYGACAHREHYRNGKQQVCKRQRQINCAHGVFPNAAGHHQPVHNRVETEHHQRRGSSGYKPRKIASQAFACEFQNNTTFLILFFIYTRPLSARMAGC